jgi:hypothetical protein
MKALYRTIDAQITAGLLVGHRRPRATNGKTAPCFVIETTVSQPEAEAASKIMNMYFQLEDCRAG